MIGDLSARHPRMARGQDGPRRWRIVVPIAVGLVLALLPSPAGLAPFAWRYLALFAATILALITEPFPPASIGLIAVTIGGAFGLVFSPLQRAAPSFNFPAEGLKWALSGFINSTIWLIFGAFVFAMGYERTGLGRRIALGLVKRLGGRTLGLGYAIAIADLVLAPFTPSNTARSGGTIFPIINRIPDLYGSAPGESSRRIGSYLMWVAFSTTCVTSSMFVTALAPNLFAIELARKVAGVDLSWMSWLRGFLPIGAPLFAALPWLVYKIYPPEIRTSAEVPRWAAQELTDLGPITIKEVIMASLVVAALALWIGGGSFVDPAMVALAAISLMVLFSLISWDDIVGNRTGWNVLVTFATLLTMAEGLSRTGVIDWVGRAVSAVLAGHGPLAVLAMLVALFFLLHYMFASLTAHATALLPAMLAAGMAVPGMPVRPFVMLMVFSVGLMGVLTPYATGPAPVYFGSGFIPRRDFWRLGLIFGVIFLVALLGLGLPTLLLLNP
jgi:L-tartrate/succinate antiporter